jgi:hypothetical protein
MKVKFESTQIIDRSSQIGLKHKVEENGVIYKYDLPLENKEIEFAHLKQLINLENIETTPMLNMWEALELTKESSFEQYVIKVNQSNNEVDMYGNIFSAG